MPIDPRIAVQYRRWDEDRRYEFDERAAIIEFDGGSSRLIAEQEAARQLGVKI